MQCTLLTDSTHEFDNETDESLDSMDTDSDSDNSWIAECSDEGCSSSDEENLMKAECPVR